ncbi:MAG: radical SAM protein [Patescibacteria group bacterium]
MKYFIKTFGCQQNHADSVRIVFYLKAQGMKPAGSYEKANYIVINTCMIRESAENRVYGLVNNLSKLKIENCKLKIIVTGCMTGMALKDKTGKFLKLLKKRLPGVDEFLAIEEIGFDTTPLRVDKTSAFVPISNGCNNFCTYCVVPYTRGREKSLPYQDIIKECLKLKKKGYKSITLLGQNVNSYGADLINVARDTSLLRGSAEYLRNPLLEEPLHSQHNLKRLKPIYVKHLGRYRIPTLFPYLLEQVAKIGFEKVDFISSNPWDFSDELIDVIARNKNITRTIHLPVQSGDDNVLKRMNRWYTRDEYLNLVANLKFKIKNLKLTTDIIVGFCGETEKEFKNTVKLCKKVGFSWAFVSVYSQRPMAAAAKILKDDVPHPVKDKRWKILDDMINKPHLKKR